MECLTLRPALTPQTLRLTVVATRIADGRLVYFWPKERARSRGPVSRAASKSAAGSPGAKAVAFMNSRDLEGQSDDRCSRQMTPAEDELHHDHP
jgi:hypothetical protein